MMGAGLTERQFQSMATWVINYRLLEEECVGGMAEAISVILADRLCLSGLPWFGSGTQVIVDYP